MKIGILGGTFDPIHMGHLRVARAAVKALKLDKLIFMPCFIPPHKTRLDIASPRDRLAMIALAIHGKAGYELSDYEINKRTTSFSFDLLLEFKKDHPHDDVYFIIGSDLVKEFPTWKNYKEIPRLAALAVIERPPHLGLKLMKGMVSVDMPPCAISSTKIREALKKNKQIKKLVPKKVAEYIINKKIYGANLDNS